MSEVPVPVTGKPHRLTLGLRPLDLADWLLIDEHRDVDLAEKAELMATRRTVVTAALPAGQAGSQETEDLVREHLRRFRPDLASAPTPAPPGDPHPIERAALLVQEDLCVMTPGPHGWLLSAASVCFPSRWLLSEKIGRTLDAIHDPVPHYAEQIAVPTRAFFDRLRVDRPMWRVNWTLLPNPRLHQPLDRTAATGTAGTAVQVDDPADLTVRLERQTLRRLPLSGDVLFTIRTIRRRLGDVVAADPDLRGRLARTLATVDDATIAYKGWESFLPQLLRSLEAPASVADGRP